MGETSFAAEGAAPLQGSGRNPVPVLVAGGASTLAALAALWFLQQNGFDPMGFYVDFVLPVGAVVVGLVASSGFALASYRLGTRVTGGLLVAVVAMLAGAYFAALYLEFHMLYPGGAHLKDGTPVGFWSYFDLVTRSIAFEDHGKAGPALGLLGYGVRALEVAGFAGGGALTPLLLRRAPYCEACNLYMRTRKLASFPTDLQAKLMGDKTPQRQEERRALLEQAQKGMDALFAAAGQGGAALRTAAAPHAPKRVAIKPPSWVELSLVHCRACHDGRLVATQYVRHGNNITGTPVREAPLTPGAVAEALSSA